MGACGLVLMSAAHAGTPVWTFSPVPGFPSSVSVSTTGTATIQYTVTNQSHRSHTLIMKPIQGITPSGCTSPLGYYQSCTLSLSVNGSALNGDIIGGPVLCHEGNPLMCYQPSAANSLAIHLVQQPTPSTAILTPSVSTLGLSVNCPPSSSCAITNAALTGKPRQITIRNTGTQSASNVTVSTSSLPSGTSISSNTCSGTLNVGAACIITITPGAVASSDSTNTACTSGTQPQGTVTVRADGGLSTQVSAYVLSYGCQYQGGFVYAVDDTTPSIGSIGGKVASLRDQADPLIISGPQSSSIIWSSNGSGSTEFDVSNDIIPFIASEPVPIAADYNTAQTRFNSTYSNTGTFPFPPPSAFALCNGSSEGQCNTRNILALYNTYNTGFGIGPSPYTLSAGPTNPTYYAAGLCTATINTYSDWYLPAICELDAVNNFQPCPEGAQSMLSNLSFLIGNPGALTPRTSCSPPSGSSCLAGVYWSSTEFNVVTPEDIAWAEIFDSIDSNQILNSKSATLGVRCSRALTL